MPRIKSGTLRFSIYLGNVTDVTQFLVMGSMVVNFTRIYDFKGKHKHSSLEKFSELNSKLRARE
jgi:hypothetical protein